MSVQKAYNIDSLREVAEGNEEFIAEMIGLFIENTRIVLSEMKMHIDQKNGEMVGKLAHSIKPNMRTYGIPDATEILLFIEKEGAPKGKWDEVLSHFQIVNRIIEASILEMEKDFNIS